MTGGVKAHGLGFDTIMNFIEQCWYIAVEDLALNCLWRSDIPCDSWDFYNFILSFRSHCNTCDEEQITCALPNTVPTTLVVSALHCLLFVSVSELLTGGYCSALKCFQSMFMYRNISYLSLYFTKSSFQFSCCTIFSIVSLIWGFFFFLSGSSCTWNCMEPISSVRNWYLEEMWVSSSYVCVHRETTCPHATMPPTQLCDWASPPSPGSHVLVSVRRLGAAVFTSLLG